MVAVEDVDVGAVEVEDIMVVIRTVDMAVGVIAGNVLTSYPSCPVQFCASFRMQYLESGATIIWLQ